MTPTDDKEKRYRIIAAAITALVAALLFLLLWFVRVAITATPPAQPSVTPALMAADEEEFLEPEDFLEPAAEVEDAGEPDPSQQLDDTPAPAPAGEPDKAPVPSDKVSVSGNNPKPNNSAEKLVTQKKPSPVKHTEPSGKNEPDSRISSEVGNKFNPHNGKPDGKQTGTQGSSDTGKGAGSAKGYLDGKRKMLSCNDRFSPRITREIKVIVAVTVDDRGHVVKARCKTHLSDKALEKRLEEESLGSTWTPKAGAPNAQGTITWTLRPAIH